jgi:MSHA pilin protein MshA
MRRVSGFTLIELVAVIAILGILGAIAIPKFFDLSTASRTSAAQGIRSAIEGGSSMNYAMKASGTSGAVSLQTCGLTGTGNLTNVVSGALTGVSLAGGSFGTTTATGNTNTCTLEYSAGGGTATVTVSVIAVSA